MHLAAAVALAHDRLFQARLVLSLQSPRFQFRETPGGGWVWRVPQERAPEDVGALSGPFADMCRIIGAPAVRIRAAVPEEVLRGDIGVQRRAAPRRSDCVPPLPRRLLQAAARTSSSTQTQLSSLSVSVAAGSALGRQVGMSAKVVPLANVVLERKLRQLASRRGGGGGANPHEARHSPRHCASNDRGALPACA